MQTSKVSLVALGFLVLAGCVGPDADSADVSADEELGSSSEAVQSSDLDVTFTGCIETIGVALVDTEAARDFVPADLVLAGEGTPVTPLVVRTARCDGISVEGGPARSGSIAQIGAVIVPPDFTGDIDNYTFWYATTHARLAKRLGDLGVDAKLVPGIEIQVDDGALHARVPRPLEARFELSGNVTVPTAPAGAFVANWWQDGCGERIKMTTNVPVIAIGASDLVLTTPPHRELGELLGGSPAGFPVLQQFNTFAAATLHAETAP